LVSLFFPWCRLVRLLALLQPLQELFLPKRYQTRKENRFCTGAPAECALWRGWGGRELKNVAPPAPPAASPSPFPFALEGGARERAADEASGGRRGRGSKRRALLGGVEEVGAPTRSRRKMAARMRSGSGKMVVRQGSPRGPLSWMQMLGATLASGTLHQRERPAATLVEPGGRPPAARRRGGRRRTARPTSCVVASGEMESGKIGERELEVGGGRRRRELAGAAEAGGAGKMGIRRGR
jgi:hypothetical protein